MNTSGTDLSPGEVGLVPGFLLVLVEGRGWLPQGDAELAGTQRVGLEREGSSIDYIPYRYTQVYNPPHGFFLLPGHLGGFIERCS
jgi:hypothetical protein